MDQLRTIIRQFRDLFLKMTGAQQLSVVSFILAFLILLGVFISSAMKPVQEKVLFWKLSAQEAAGITEKLDDLNYWWDWRNGALVVDSSVDVKRLHMSLSQEGLLPEDMSFDFNKMIEQSNFTHTRDERNNMRELALMNEIAEGLKGNSDILDAKVIISQDEPSPLLRTHIPRTASVKVKVRGNRTLSTEEVRGIIAWVSRAVKGLDPNNVTIIDGRNRPYSLDMGAGGADKLEMTWRAEQHYANKVESMLQEFIPKVKATVSLSLDLSKHRYEKKDYNDKRLNKEGSSVLTQNFQEKESSESKEGSQGVAGAGTNSAAEIKEGDGGEQMSSDRSTKKELFDPSVVQEFITYDGLKMQFNGVSVVVVDKKLNFASAGDGVDGSDETNLSRYVDANWLAGDTANGASIKELVAASIGISSTDLVKITQQSMEMPTTLEAPTAMATIISGLQANAYLLLMGFLSLLGAIILIRMVRRAQPEEEILEMPVYEEKKENNLPPLKEPEVDPKMQQVENRVKEIIEDDPLKAASLIRHWLSSE